MAWKAAQPHSAWGDKERNDFSREIHARLKFGSFTWNPPAIGPTTQASFVASAIGPDIITQTVTGLQAGMPVKVTPPGVLPLGVTMQEAVLTANTLTITIDNSTGAPITPPAGSWSFAGTVI